MNNNYIVELSRNGHIGWKVDLLTPERGGAFMAVNKGVFQTHEEAETEAQRVAKLYGASITDKSATE